MSRIHSVFRVAAKVAVVALCMISSNKGQSPVTGYVCQTANFWCSFNEVSGVPNGTPCHCNTLLGPVPGFSIDPGGVSNAPRLPKPQKPQPSQGGGKPQTNEDPVTVGADDCYKGLGNCPGSFAKAAAGRGTKKAGSTISTFGAGLQKLIDAADEGFDDVRGDAKSSKSKSTTERYEVEAVPDGMDFCTLFVPESSSRRPWVSCFAPDDMTYTQLNTRISGALGKAGSGSSGGRVWRVGNAQIETSRDPVSVDVRLARD